MEVYFGLPVEGYGEYDHELTPEVLREVQRVLRSASRARALSQNEKAS